MDLIPVIEMFASIIECIISVLFMVELFGYKENKYSTYNYGIAVFAVILLNFDNVYLSQREGYELLSIILLIVILFVFSLVALKGRIYQKIIASLTVPMLIMLISMGCLYLISAIANVDVMDLYNVNHEARLLLLFVTKFAFFLAARLGVHFFRVKENKLATTEWVLLISLFVLSFSIMMIFWIESIRRELPSNLYLAILACVILIDVIVYWLMKRINQLHAEKTDLALNAMVYEAKCESIDMILRQNEEIRGIKHDMNNQMVTLSLLLQQYNVEEAQELLDKMNTSSTSRIELFYFTNDEVVDAILNSKMHICDRKEIEIEHHIDKDCIGKTDNRDVSILLANLLDNAIEAEEKLDRNRFIKCKLERYQKCLHILIENRIEESVLESNPQLMTTKEDTYNHGFGTKTIKSIVDKYNGVIRYAEKGRFFSVDVQLLEEK